MRLFFAFLVLFALHLYAPLNAAEQNTKKRIAVIVQKPLPESGRSAIELELNTALLAQGVQARQFELQSFSFMMDLKKLESLVPHVLQEYKPDLIVCYSVYAVKAFAQVTKSTPIVFGLIGDPVEFKVIDKPGASKDNLTGYTEQENMVPAAVMTLRRVIKNKPLHHIGLLHGSALRNEWLAETNRLILSQKFEGEGRFTSEFKLSTLTIQPQETVVQLMQRLSMAKIDGVIFIHDNHLHTHSERVADLSRNLTIPSMVLFEKMAEKGALLHYDAVLKDTEQVMADYITRLLFKGAKPTDLKVLGPNSYDIAVNETTAKRHGWVLDTKKVPGIRVVK